MFTWYKDAEICYAFLADVPAEAFNEVGGDLFTPLEKSKWFTRGWTLQELIAPPEVAFYSQEWRAIGTKESLKETISEITGIDVLVLQMRREPSCLSVAQKMSWAANRRTTRLEDEAYCLMGLFGVNMPLLYGEGQKAFKRLQLEIMKETYDPTILAWGAVDSFMTVTGVLAPSSDAFEGCKDITWEPDSSLRTNASGEPKFSHDIVGRLLKMDAAIVPLDMPSLDLRPDGDDAAQAPSARVKGSGLGPADRSFMDMTHFPMEGSYTDKSNQFNYNLIRSNGHDMWIVMLHGCSKRKGLARRTIGITVRSHLDGTLRRVHYPTRFLLPFDWTWMPKWEQKTLYLALSGTETLAHLKRFFTLSRCLVRVPATAVQNVPYYFSHTIPDKAPASVNCWYVDRWTDATDLATLSPQLGFAIRDPGVGRAIAFRHRTEEQRSFLVVFSYARFTEIGDRCLVNFEQGEEAMCRSTVDHLTPLLPEPGHGPQFEVDFALGEQWILRVAIRRARDSNLAILRFRRASGP